MVTSGAQMVGLGAELKRRREERAIELQEISNTTRIGLRYLRAIEENDFKALPGGLFTRSFIKTYARYVGMDETQALQQFIEETGQAKDPTGRYEIALDSVRKKARQSFWAGVGIGLSVLIVLGLGGAAGWHFWQRSKAKNAVAGETTPASQIINPTDSPAQPPPQDPGNASHTSSQTDPGTSPDGVKPPATRNRPDEETAEAQDSLSSLPVQDPEPSAARGPLEIRLEAIDVCRISVATDQGRTRQETLRAGETRSFRPQQRVVLSASNLANLRVLINGKLAKIATSDHAARELVISKDNFQQYLRR